MRILIIGIIMTNMDVNVVLFFSLALVLCNDNVGSYNNTAIYGDFAIVCGNDGGLYTASMDSLDFKPILRDLNFPMSVAYDKREEKIYFTSYDAGSKNSGHFVSRCDLNGSNVEVVIATEKYDFTVQGFTLDIKGRGLFVSIVPGGLIVTRGFEGGNITLVVSDVVSPRDMFYYENRIYWTDSGMRLIRSCDLDGRNLVTHVYALKAPWGIYVDPCEEKIYWTDTELLTIERSSLWGQQREIIIVGANSLSVAVYREHVYFVDRSTNLLYRALTNGTGEKEEVGTGTEYWYHPSHLYIHTGYPCGPAIPTVPPSTITNDPKTTPSTTTQSGTTEITTDAVGTTMATGSTWIDSTRTTWTDYDEITTDEPYADYSIVLPITLGVLLSVLPISGLMIFFNIKRNKRILRKRRISYRLRQDQKEKVIMSRDLGLWVKDTFKITLPTISIRQSSSETADPKAFPRHRLTIIDQLGEGAFGAVYKAEAIGFMGNDTTIVAVKRLKEPASDAARTDFLQELALYKSFREHRNIISMLGYCTEEEPYFIILEYAPNGNLKGYLDTIRVDGSSSCQEQMSKSLNPTHILQFASQIANGMDYLASNNCIHRDLAARNILLGEGMVCKLSDFGLARNLQGESQYEMKSEGRVPIRWMAPEAVLYNKCTTQSDVWSFGILLWELVTLGSHPYPGLSARRLLAKITSGYRLAKPPHCSNEIYSIMYECWHKDPKQRPSFNELYKNITKMLEDAEDYLEMSDFDMTDYDYVNPTTVTGFTGATSGGTSHSSDSNESITPARYVVDPGNLRKQKEAECWAMSEVDSEV